MVVTSRDVLHNSLQSVIARSRAIRCVAFFANSSAIGCKKTPCGLSRSALPPTREGYAGHPLLMRCTMPEWWIWLCVATPSTRVTELNRLIKRSSVP